MLARPLYDLLVIKNLGSIWRRVYLIQAQMTDIENGQWFVPGRNVGVPRSGCPNNVSVQVLDLLWRRASCKM